MPLTITYGPTKDNRERILQTLLQRKQDTPGYRVLDVGGIAGGGWSAPVADLVIDINAPNTDTSLSIDICNADAWAPLFEHVTQHGRFDYTICTHTLEDVYDPFVTLNNLPKVAKAGIITMPSMQTEVSHVESPHWIGYIHHRWLYDHADGRMLIAPKISALEALCLGRNLPFIKAREEIQYHWEDDIPYTMFMNNYLGPNVQTVVSEYVKLLNRHTVNVNVEVA